MQPVLTAFDKFLDWAPTALIGAIILTFAGLFALLLHAVLTRLVRRILLGEGPYLISLLSGTVRPTQLGILILALFIALQATPFDAETQASIAKALLIGGIIVIGWIAITATHIVADIYLQRFHIDVDDNFLARKHVTQIRVLRRVTDTILIIITIGAALMSFEAVRQYGVSLFASAGVAGLVVGLAARPVLGNLIAGIQLAMTQPIRIDDTVVVEGENGQIEEITATYVVLRLWDLRRMVVPLTYFIEKPFQNWTRDSRKMTGTVLLQVDYSTPIERLRAKAIEIARASPFWDGDVLKVHVTDTTATAVVVRVIASARTSGDAFELRAEIREKLIGFLQTELPDALPTVRQITLATDQPAAKPQG
jgi:small-conductance mechanosensitive channel